MSRLPRISSGVFHLLNTPIGIRDYWGGGGEEKRRKKRVFNSFAFRRNEHNALCSVQSMINSKSIPIPKIPTNQANVVVIEGQHILEHVHKKKHRQVHSRQKATTGFKSANEKNSGYVK